MSNLLTEKYRPNSLDNLYLNPILKDKIKYYLNTDINHINNLIFEGPSGTGKTSTALFLAKHITYGSKDSQDKLIMEINASDDRGIEILNNTVIQFCKLKIDINKKVLIFDEADNLTNRAQLIISNFIDDFKKVIFIFTCNSKNNIIEKIQSRCDTLYYESIPNEMICQKLEKIIDIEKINISSDILDYIINESNGDLRKAISLLEMCSFNSDIIKNNYINFINDFIMIIFESKEYNLSKILGVMNEMVLSGFSRCDIVIIILNQLKKNNNHDNEIHETIKIKMYKILYEYYNIFKNYVDSSIQFTSCILKLLNISKNK